MSDDRTVWGIDPRTGLLAFAVYRGETCLEIGRVVVDQKLRGADRFAAIYRLAAAQASMTANDFEPDAVFIEQPSGKWTQNDFVGSWAVTLAALRAALPDVPIYTVAPAKWKKRALGNGAAKKSDVMRWAKGQDRPEGINLEDLLQDEADAMGIARGGAILLEEGEQMKLDAKREPEEAPAAIG